MTIKSQPATDAYRSGWDRVFGNNIRICPPPCRHKETKSILDDDGNLFECMDCGIRWNPEQRAA